jgi:hypothetical protein
MKISEMTNAQATEALIRLADPIGNLCDDEEIAGLLQEFGNMGDTPVIQTIGKLIPKFIMYGLKKHVDDVYEVVGALTFKTKEQVKEMNFAETVKVVKDSYDDILASFFTQSKAQARKKGAK